MLMAGIVFSYRYKFPQTILNLRPIEWVGKLSYSLYVWHLLGPEVISWALPGVAHHFEAILAFIFSFAVSSCSYYLVEQPIVKLRQRFGSRTV